MSAVAIGRAVPVVQTHTFSEVEGGHYRLTILPLGIQFDIDRLRRDKHELKGELCVTCDFAIESLNGVISIGDWTVSAESARYHRAQALERHAHASASGFNWTLLLDEFAHRVLLAERDGEPARLLSSFPKRGPEAEFLVDGWPLLRNHATIAFGDGGSAKSYLALYVAGRLTLQGHRILYVDWELEGSDHRERLECMFGPDMPEIPYVRCDRALVYAVDHLQREIRRHHIDYLICDSIGFATPGPPEAAEHAMSYFRALRQLHVGSLNLAHINKSEGGDQKPFGSAFWHNSARATWFIKQADEDDQQVEGHRRIGLFNRKSNLSKKRAAIGFSFEFGETTTIVQRADVSDVQEFAKKLPLWQRVEHLLKTQGGRPLTKAEITEHLGANPESIARLFRPTRVKSIFTILPGTDGTARIALATRHG